MNKMKKLISFFLVLGFLLPVLGVSQSNSELKKTQIWLKKLDVKNENGKNFSIKELKNLTKLNLRSTRVTDKGVKNLNISLPNCKIHYK